MGNKKPNTIPYDHLHEQASYIKPYVQRDHSWNVAEFDHSHEKNWDKETKAPTGDTHYEPGTSVFGREADGSMIQTDPQALASSDAKYDHKWESHSVIMPYKQRDHSWNHAQHDNTNFYDFRDDAKKGYHDTVTYEEPHPTNIPYLQPSDPPEKCEEDATAALKSATTSEEMKAAKDAVDKCVSTLKKELDSAEEENKDTTGQTIGKAAGMGEPKPKKADAKKDTAPKKDDKASKAKAGGKEPAKPDLSKKGGKKEDSKKDGKKEEKPVKNDKMEDAGKKLEKEAKADDKKEKADAKKGKEQKS